MTGPAVCPACAADLRDGARFCARCGTPRTGSSTGAAARGRRTGWVALLVVGVAAVLVAVAVGMREPAGEEARTVAIPQPAPSAGPADGTVTPPSTVPTTPAAADPAATLASRVATDRARAETLAGMWLPQVASKRPGINVAGSGDVHDELRRIEATNPDSRFVLVRSGDWSSFKQDGYWVVLASAGYSSARDANRWCDAHGFPASGCYAKRLSHSEGPEGNAVPR